VPDELTRAILKTSGFCCEDIRTLRLVSVAAQHFVAAVLDEAINLGKRRRMAPAQHLRNEGHNPRDRRQILSSEDLGEALQEYGVAAQPAPFYLDTTAKKAA
ncbi:hypothetical protein H632_c2912p0, partial [Helicosporidium sp. ATCC 50920]